MDSGKHINLLFRDSLSYNESKTSIKFKKMIINSVALVNILR